MNFLAHLYLSEPTAEHRIGQLMPDMVRGRLPRGLPIDVARGVQMHRRIDAFTDTHRVVQASKSRIRERQGRFSGILIDVFYDHFLAADWPRWNAQPRQAFIQTAYEGLVRHHATMPPRMQAITDHMIDQDWLGTYATVEGIDLTLSRMSVGLTERFGREVDFRSAADDLRTHHESLAADFAEFFPALIDHVNDRNDRSPTSSASEPGSCGSLASNV